MVEYCPLCGEYVYGSGFGHHVLTGCDALRDTGAYPEGRAFEEASAE